MTETLPPAPIGDGRSSTASFRPADVDSLREVVRDRVAAGEAIYPRGGASALDYGGIPARPGVSVDTRSLDRLIDYPAADMTITIEAGMTLAALRAILDAQGQRLLIDAPDPDRATLGAIYATNTAGPRRFGWGRPRDQIIGVGFVTSDGALVRGGGRVVKNVAGYDFPRLLTGSMGTLGVIAQLTLKVRPRPEAAAIAWIPISDPSAIAGRLEALNTSATRPVAVELLNPAGAAIVARAAGAGLPTESPALVVGFEDNADSVRWQLDRLGAEAGVSDRVVVEGDDARPIWEALTAFQAEAPGPFSIAANVRPSTVAAMVLGLDPSRWAAQAHAGNGIVRAHALGDWSPEEAEAAIAPLRARAVLDGGNLTLPRCPTEWKDRLRVWGEPRADRVIADRVRAALDPHHAMNPGRFVVG